MVRLVEDVAGPGAVSLLESALPWAELSKLAAADQRARDPIYGVHRWWARRPPAVMRGLLLAQAVEQSTPLSDFWDAFADPAHALEGLTAYDPFSGGGSTLVEARRLGADVQGSDVDPLAVLITNFELAPPAADDLAEAGKAMIEVVTKFAQDLYPSTPSSQPLHYFHLRDVTCPQCDVQGTLYRNLVLARDVGKVGAVVRDAALSVFCPDCFTVHNLAEANRIELRCCNRRHRLTEGTFEAGRYTCKECGRRSNHTDLRTGVAPLRLVAVEDTVEGGRRIIRAPDPADHEAHALASTRLSKDSDLIDLPSAPFDTERREARPLSYGIVRPTDLFSDRQLLCLGRAFRWIRNSDIKPAVRQGLRLALSNSLTTNNLLCGYATDYGRISALFSVRSYSLPALSIELNPLHPGAGRGTLPRSLQRVVRSTSASARRHVWSNDHKSAKRELLDFRPSPAPGAVRCESAANGALATHSVDLCITDPPYFDFIYYSELSEFHRAWLDLDLEAAPLLPEADGDRVLSFSIGLGDCLRESVRALKPGRVLAFTYHATSDEAWEAVGLALDGAKLGITAMWPLRNDAHMGLHSSDGNCEWDVVVVCRRLNECARTDPKPTLSNWEESAQTAGLGFSPADRRNIQAAITMATTRFARPSVLGD